MDGQPEAADRRALLSPEASPEQMFEVPREITILKGAISSVDRRVRELLERLEPVVRPSEPTAETTAKYVGPDSLPVSTRYAIELRELQHELSRLEDSVSYTLHRLEM